MYKYCRIDAASILKIDLAAKTTAPRSRTILRRGLLVICSAALLAVLAASAYADTGPDVSSWQHPSGAAINWSQVHSDGHSFAIVKATEGPVSGSPYTNPYFTSDWAAVKANGMYRGAYHFARPALPTAQSATDQANYFLSVVGNTSEGGDLPPALDLEVTGGLSSSDLIAWTQTFLSTVQASTGRKPLIYFSPNFWTSYMNNTTAFNSYPLWLAYWTTSSSPPLPGGWSQYTFWQYTDAASVPGISGNVDMSRYCCDSASLGGLAYNAAQWAKWYPLGGAATDKVSLGINGDGRLEAFVRAADGIEHIWQNSPGGGWTAWWSLSGAGGGDPVVATNRDGRLEAFFVGIDGQLWHNWQQSPSGIWGNWWSLGGSFAGRPAVKVNGDGRLEVLARGIDGAIWHTWQTAAGGAWTSTAYSLGGTTTGDPAAATNLDGRLEVFTRRADGTVWHCWQTSPGGGWGDWWPLGGNVTGTPTVAPNKDGRMEVFATGADKALWHSWQTSPNGGWYPMSSFGGSFTGDPAVGINADQRLEAFAVDAQGQVEHAWQTSPGGLWVPFATLSGFTAASSPGIGRNADGRLEILVRKSDGTVWHAWQTAKNGGL
jgi:GH25 family lysozyme M1 (1,4-beta-N-acetylmuramidase)